MKTLALTGILILFAWIACAQSYIVKIDKIDAQDGLLHNTVRTVAEDKDHNLWIGTDGGLCFYDGFNCIGYHTGNSALRSELIRALCFTSSGKLVIHTATQDRPNISEGLYLMDADGKIVRQSGFDEGPQNRQSFDARQFFQDAYYLCDDRVLWKYDLVQDAWSSQELPQGFIPESVQDGFVSGYVGDQHCAFSVLRPEVILDVQGLAELDPGYARIFQAYPALQSKSAAVEFHNCVYDTARNVLWAYGRFGMLALDSRGDEICCTVDCSPLIFEKRLEAVQISAAGFLLLPSNDGLLVGKVMQSYFTQYRISSEYFDPDTRQEQSARGLAVVDSVLYMNIDNFFLRQPLNSSGKQELLYTTTEGRFFPMYFDGEAVWSGRQRLLRYDIAARHCEVIPSRLTSNLSSLWSFFRKDDKVYLGSQKGVNIIDYEELKAGRIEFVCDTAKNTFFVYQITDTPKGILYVTTSGLYRLGSDGCIPEVIEFIYPDGAPVAMSNLAHCTAVNDSMFWVASQDAGVAYCKLKGNSAIVLNSLNRDDGMPTNTCYAVYPDAFGGVWISTDMGLVQLNTRDWSFRMYTTEDGLPTNEFNRISHCTDDDGNLYFGGLQGVAALTPADFYPPPSDDIDLRILKVQAFTAWDDTIVDVTHEVKRTHKVVFHPGDKFLRIEVGLADFFRIPNHRYEYRIRGLYDEWQSMQGNRLTLNVLPYGTHDIEIRGRNADGRYSKNQLTIEVLARLPFYLRLWFIALVIGGFVLVVREYWVSRNRRERKRAEELEDTVRRRTVTISKQADELQELQQVRSRFFANISHELRTPLTLIKGPVQSLLDREDQSPAARAYLHVIDQNTSSLTERIDDLLFLSRIDANQLTLQEQDFELKSFLGRITDLFHARATEKSIQLSVVCPYEEPVFIKADKKKLEHIISNYVSNAIKFTPEHGSITISGEVAEGMLVVRVSDTGEGIAQEHAGQVFERFYQAPSQVNQSSGTGIGLSICKELAEAMGGSVALESEFGQGSTFSVEIPFRPGSAHTIQEPVPRLNGYQSEELEESPVLSEEQEKLHTLMLVEDNPSMRSFLVAELRKYTVIECVDGQNGLDTLQEMKAAGSLPDCIISDVMMPVMDGFEMVAQIKRNPELNTIPVIMLTARAGLEDKLEGLRIGVDDYIQKPFDMRELKARIANILARIPARREEETPEDTLTGVDQQWLKELEQQVLGHLSHSDFTMDQLADTMHISRRQMYRKVKLYTGLAANAYVREVRLFEARKLCENRAVATVAELSYAVGFEDPDYFSRIYAERFGYRPREKL